MDNFTIQRVGEQALYKHRDYPNLIFLFFKSYLTVLETDSLINEIDNESVDKSENEPGPEIFHEKFLNFFGSPLREDLLQKYDQHLPVWIGIDSQGKRQIWVGKWKLISHSNKARAYDYYVGIDEGDDGFLTNRAVDHLPQTSFEISQCVSKSELSHIIQCTTHDSLTDLYGIRIALLKHFRLNLLTFFHYIFTIEIQSSTMTSCDSFTELYEAKVGEKLNDFTVMKKVFFDYIYVRSINLVDMKKASLRPFVSLIEQTTVLVSLIAFSGGSEIPESIKVRLITV